MGDPGISESQRASSFAIALIRAEATETPVGRVIKGANSENSCPDRVFKV
jgi:hypothetical protein